MSRFASPVLIIGARSDIAMSLAQAYAARGCALLLAARNSAGLAIAKADLELRYNVTVTTIECDVVADEPEQFFDRLGVLPETLLMVVGLLGDQAQSEADVPAAQLVMKTNYSGPASFLLAGGKRMAARGSGVIIGISSVAGDRGRGSNFVYGSAKAGFTAFLSGLRNALAKKGVHVMTVKPGFVRTSMTSSMDLPPRLTAEPEEVATAVIQAQLKRRDVIYVKSVWWLIMTVIHYIPERRFKKLSL